MDLLKLVLTTLSTLVLLDYSKRASEIIFVMDTSLEKWGEVLIQLVQEKRHFSRYKSGMGSYVKKKYDATK